MALPSIPLPDLPISAPTVNLTKGAGKAYKGARGILGRAHFVPIDEALERDGKDVVDDHRESREREASTRRIECSG
jgi:hypothetical protein